MRTLRWVPDPFPCLIALGVIFLHLETGCSSPSSTTKSASHSTATKESARLVISCGLDPIEGQTLPSGARGVTLYARCSEPITALEWDLGGGGIIQETGYQYADINWQKLGRFTGRVRGDTPSGKVETTFEYVLSGPDESQANLPTESPPAVAVADPHQWTRVPLTFLDGNVQAPVATVINGNPSIVGEVFGLSRTSAQLLVACASKPVPTSADDWHVTTLDSGHRHNAQLLVTERAGKLQILLTSDDWHTRWASAQVELPTAPADWTIRNVQSGTPSDFGFLGDRPVIVSRSGGVTIGSSADPVSTSDWRYIDFKSVIPQESIPYMMGSSHMDDGFAWQVEVPSRKPASLFIIEDHLLIARESYQGLTLAVATTTTPASNSDFEQYLLPPYFRPYFPEQKFRIHGFVLQNHLSLLVTSPLYGSSIPGSNTAGDFPPWYQATVPVPISAVDWKMGTLRPGDHLSFPMEVGATIDSRPAILTRVGTNFRAALIRGSYEDFGEASAWESIYFPGEFSDGFSSASLLDTDAGLAMLIPGLDTSGPVMVYPDLPLQQ